MYTNFLFDLDGVLVDTSELQYLTTKESIFKISNFNVECEYIDKILKSTITTIKKLEKLNDMNIITKNQIQEIYELKKKKADEYFLKLKNDIDKIKLFEYLKQKNCKIGVVTNGNRNSAKIILKGLGLYHLIDVLITNDDVINSKPHPEPYLKAIDFLNAKLNECIIFEDSEVGLLSAKQSGCQVYQVLNVNDVNIGLIHNYI
jgi:beta-phosphoglucomutase